MAKGGTLREVQCYHCGAQFEISARAMTVSCPKCYKKLLVEDVVIKAAQGVTKLQTCGKIIIEKKGRVTATLVEAHQGLEVHGILESKVLCGGPVVIGDKGRWKGDCRAPSVEIAPGARITSGYFEIAPANQSDRFGLSALPGPHNKPIAHPDPPPNPPPDPPHAPPHENSAP